MNRYKNIGILADENGRRYRRNPIFPVIPAAPDDLYVISTAGDRYDTLALDYYNDPSLWWIIAASNNQGRDSLAVKPGIQLRIPMNTSNVISQYNALNKNR